MSECFRFGPYSLDVTARSLRKGPSEVALGSRAFDILTALLRAEGAILSTRELMAAAWPGLVVEDSNIRVQIAHLRRAIGCGENGVRRIGSVPGRGYSFVAEAERVTVGADWLRGTTGDADSARSTANYITTAQAKATVGREDCIAELAQLMLQRRLITVVGAGGLGKTTLALETLSSIKLFRDKVFVVDLSASSAYRVMYDIASTVGYRPSGDVTLSGLAEYLECLHPLLILDSCEHVIDAVAAICGHVMGHTRSVSLLCTSREPMRISDEYVYQLRPLQMPREGHVITTVDVDAWAAVKLFVSRASEGGATDFMSDDGAEQIACICRRLGGNPHAIELVASRVGTYGVPGVSSMLSSGAALQWQGRRDASPRHQTVEATLDWTYELLPELHQVALRRLCVFAGEFTMEAAIDVLSDQMLNPSATAEALADLVEKSLVAARPLEGKTKLRLLDTTRAYAMRKLAEGEESRQVARRHALYYAGKIIQQEYDLLPASDSRLPPQDEYLENVRAAIEWAATRGHDRELLMSLCAGAAPMFLQNRLFHDCLRACDLALASIPEEFRDGTVHLAIIEAQAIALASTAKYGEILKSCNAGLRISHQLEHKRATLHLIGGLHLEAIASGSFLDACQLAEKYAAIAAAGGDSTELVIADWLRGASYHFIGKFSEADTCFAGSRRRTAQASLRALGHFDVKAKLHASIGMTRTKWAKGLLSQALHLAFKSIDEFRDHPDALFACITMAMPVILMNDLDVTGEGLVKELQSVSPVYRVGLRPHVIQMLKGMIHLRRSDYRDAERLLRGCLPAIQLQPPRIYLLHDLAEALLETGSAAEALHHIDEAIALTESSAGTFNLAELQRVRAMSLMAMSGRSALAECRRILDQAFLTAERQGAPCWQLGIAVSRVHLEQHGGDIDAARLELRRIHDLFSEGLETRLLREAEALIA